jgi:hypothetical protein
MNGSQQLCGREAQLAPKKQKVVLRVANDLENHQWSGRLRLW